MTRIIYHVTPSNGKWQISKGHAKKPSFVFSTKTLAVRKSADLAKGNRLAQVVIHGSDGKIVSDRIYELNDFKKKMKIKVAVRKSNKTKTRNKLKAIKETNKHRKSAVLGINRKYRKKLKFRKSVRIGIAKSKKMA